MKKRVFFFAAFFIVWGILISASHQGRSDEGGQQRPEKSILQCDPTAGQSTGIGGIQQISELEKQVRNLCDQFGGFKLPNKQFSLDAVTPDLINKLKKFSSQEFVDAILDPKRTQALQLGDLYFLPPSEASKKGIVTILNQDEYQGEKQKRVGSQFVKKDAMERARDDWQYEDQKKMSKDRNPAEQLRVDNAKKKFEKLVRELADSTRQVQAIEVDTRFSKDTGVLSSKSQAKSCEHPYPFNFSKSFEKGAKSFYVNIQRRIHNGKLMVALPSGELMPAEKYSAIITDYVNQYNKMGAALLNVIYQKKLGWLKKKGSGLFDREDQLKQSPLGGPYSGFLPDGEELQQMTEVVNKQRVRSGSGYSEVGEEKLVSFQERKNQHLPKSPKYLTEHPDRLGRDQVGFLSSFYQPLEMVSHHFYWENIRKKKKRVEFGKEFPELELYTDQSLFSLSKALSKMGVEVLTYPSDPRFVPCDGDGAKFLPIYTGPVAADEPVKLDFSNGTPYQMIVVGEDPVSIVEMSSQEIERLAKEATESFRAGKISADAWKSVLQELLGPGAPAIPIGIEKKVGLDGEQQTPPQVTEFLTKASPIQKLRLQAIKAAVDESIQSFVFNSLARRALNQVPTSSTAEIEKNLMKAMGIENSDEYFEKLSGPRDWIGQAISAGRIDYTPSIGLNFRSLAYKNKMWSKSKAQEPSSNDACQVSARWQDEMNEQMAQDQAQKIKKPDSYYTGVWKVSELIPDENQAMQFAVVGGPDFVTSLLDPYRQEAIEAKGTVFLPMDRETKTVRVLTREQYNTLVHCKTNEFQTLLKEYTQFAAQGLRASDFKFEVGENPNESGLMRWIGRTLSDAGKVVAGKPLDSGASGSHPLSSAGAKALEKYREDILKFHKNLNALGLDPALWNEINASVIQAHLGVGESLETIGQNIDMKVKAFYMAPKVALALGVPGGVGALRGAAGAVSVATRASAARLGFALGARSGMHMLGGLYGITAMKSTVNAGIESWKKNKNFVDKWVENLTNDAASATIDAPMMAMLPGLGQTVNTAANLYFIGSGFYQGGEALAGWQQTQDMLEKARARGASEEEIKELEFQSWMQVSNGSFDVLLNGFFAFQTAKHAIPAISNRLKSKLNLGSADAAKKALAERNMAQLATEMRRMERQGDVGLLELQKELAEIDATPDEYTQFIKGLEVKKITNPRLSEEIKTLVASFKLYGLYNLKDGGVTNLQTYLNTLRAFETPSGLEMSFTSSLNQLFSEIPPDHPHHLNVLLSKSPPALEINQILDLVKSQPKKAELRSKINELFQKQISARNREISPQDFQDSKNKTLESLKEELSKSKDFFEEAKKLREELQAQNEKLEDFARFCEASKTLPANKFGALLKKVRECLKQKIAVR